jgi:hypothetical protein
MDEIQDYINWSALVANIVTSIGIIGFGFIYLAHRQSQNQFKFTVMLSCIDRFQHLSPLLRGDNDDISRLKRYVDLTNEEFFYFQREYIPKEIMVEWMDSIVDCFPIYVNGSDIPINYDRLPFKQIHDENLLKGYPRLMKAFTLNREMITADKANLIKTVAQNLGISLKTIHFKRAHVL